MLFLCAVFLVIFPVRDYDTFWHVANGRAMVNGLRIVNEEIFSYSANGTPFVNHNWLAQVIIYLFFVIAGFPGLVLFKVLLMSLIFWILYRVCRSLGADRLLSSFLCFWTILAGISRFTVRPQLFSYLGLVLLVHILFGYRSGALGRRVLCWLPPLMILWDVLHGSIYGLIFLGAFLAAESLKYLLGNRSFMVRQPPMKKGQFWTLWKWTGFTLLCMLINPYGLRTYSGFFVVVNNDFIINMTGEFMPPTFGEFWAFWALLVLVAGLLLVRIRRADLTHLAIILPFAYLALKYNRAVAVFALVAVPLVAVNICAILPYLTSQKFYRMGRNLAAGMMVVCCVILVGYLKFAESPGGMETGMRPGFGLNENYFPVGSERFIKEVGLTGNLFNTDRFGGYLSYFFYPDRKIFHYNHPSVFRDLYSYLHNPSSRQKWNHNYAILAKEAEIKMFQVEGWVPVYWEPTAMVMVRPTAENQEVIRRYRIRYFQPLLPSGQLQALMTNSNTAPAVIQEVAVYLTYRSDPRIAKIFGQTLASRSDILPPGRLLPLLQQVMQFNGNNPFIEAATGLAYYRQKQFVDAQKYFRLALESDGNLEFARINLAYLDLDLGQYQEAEKEFRKLLKRNPENADGIYGMGLTHLRQGNMDLAKENFRKYLELSPDGQMTESARNYLGQP